MSKKKYSKEKFEAVWKEAKEQRVTCSKKDFLDDYLDEFDEMWAGEITINGIVYTD